MGIMALIFKLENSLTAEQSQKWFQKIWPLSILAIGLYLVLIIGGQYLMKNRRRFDLHIPLALWSFAMAGFSIWGTCRTLPELLGVFSRNQDGVGFYHSICTSGYDNNPVQVFWLTAYALSKIVQLGDTIFMILRKQKLIFLHWYHHVTVVGYSFLSVLYMDALTRHAVSINFLEHSLMYTYYGFRALRFSFPKSVPFAITSFQLLQMTLGIGVSLSGLYYKQRHEYCRATNFVTFYTLVIYTSYFILFANFFHKTYLSKSQSSPKADSSKKKMV